MATVKVDIELDEFDDEEVIEYAIELLSNSHISDKKKKRFEKILKDNYGLENHEILGDIDLDNLSNKMKFEYLVSIFDKYSIEEIESKLP